MVGIRVAFDAEVGIEVGGRVEREYIDPCERLYGYDAPFSSHRIIDVEEWNNFCVNIRLGTTFRQLVDPVDRGIMILIQLDGMEVLRRLVTRRGFSHVGLAQPLRLNYRGALSLDSSHGSQLRRFQFAGANGKRAINGGSIRVELFLVKLLRPPKRSKNAALRVKREEPDDDVVQSPHSGAGKAVVSNKRKVDSALGYTSPPRPTKFVALDMDEPEEPEVSEECQHQKAIKKEPEPPVQLFGELEMDS
ncbi:hypothetical protein CTRI78_v005378 [Colletotrichum trifolii]|uniref:Uncharacterized protein n=1 Tax=Colletotrichum trifolii TaxID=5466 RepID=A0A4R8RLR6_COLTR|nr:hypothetical protein CTRI78_v005378 [Colletotrichum trifolii]